MYDPVCLKYSDIGLLENVISLFDLQNSRTIEISDKYKQKHLIHIYLLHKLLLQLDNVSRTFRYVFKPNTTDAEEIMSHFQNANISLVDVACKIVVIGKLQETCRPLQVI